MDQLSAADFIAAARDALSADAQLAAWCQQQFSRGPAVYAGIDESSPPAQEDYPLIAIVDLRTTAGAAANRRGFEMDIGFCLVNDTVSAGGLVKTYDGLLQVETFRELGEMALLRAFKSPHARFTGASEKLSLYPVFVSFTTFALEEIQSRRKPRFA